MRFRGYYPGGPDARPCDHQIEFESRYLLCRACVDESLYLGVGFSACEEEARAGVTEELWPENGGPKMFVFEMI